MFTLTRPTIADAGEEKKSLQLQIDFHAKEAAKWKHAFEVEMDSLAAPWVPWAYTVLR